MTELKIDPITLEILLNALRSVADEAYNALTRSAYSTNIKERKDHSTAIMDAKGRLVAQAENSLPIHLSSMAGLMHALLKKYSVEEIHEGDIFVSNDPHAAGGSHLPDINLASPVFYDGKLLAFACNIAHHADVGGMAPGSVAGGMTEIYQEGLRIPAVKLFDRGRLVRDLFEILLLNVRVPSERRGDYNAQIAACRLSERRMTEIAERYSAETLAAAFDEIILRTESRLRAAILGMPDGAYSFEDVMDDDGCENFDIRIAATVRISGDRISFDFEGTAPQAKGNINSPYNASHATLCYVLKALVDPDVPNNEGVLNVCEMIAEPGSLVNCAAPAACASRANTCQRIVDVVIGALAEALPEAVVAASNGANTAAVYSGHSPSSGEPYVYLETIGGGFGGRATKDGTDGVQVHSTNTSNLPIEVVESEYPLRVARYELVANSGGAGEYRGGLAIRRDVMALDHFCTFSGQGERFRHRPWGLFGGARGETGRFELISPQNRRTSLPGKPMAVEVPPGATISVQTAGGGGYGSPEGRSPEARADDLASGKFSSEYMKTHYGQP
ncbi:MAG: hydantoinase B/oxoprolinase family protein [Albidovulum sp.]|nr:hydantoinase B/oxoprolinase family protein [Albidovulum sp.]